MGPMPGDAYVAAARGPGLDLWKWAPLCHLRLTPHRGGVDASAEMVIDHELSGHDGRLLTGGQ